ncbi:ABC transporter ATP-binding protein/permease wht-1 [Armadillidium vulgare]|nr:ABC transporter ATP-binding protein/permease wht-1 [Armadillidium vulgare]
MDIFDTFFLVEYLRQWAARGRIVILTIQPPTYEIFTMISRVALISTGRLMYFGKRREMLPYFAYIEYPCPAYKNPSDYYIDLVTLDDLSAEAMLESSQRVEMLAEAFRRRQEPLSDPGPQSPLPPKIKHSNLCIQLLFLWIRAMIYQFPYNMLHFLGQVIVAAIMSVLAGAIFLNLRNPPEMDQMCYSFPTTVLVYLAYILPAYTMMAGFRGNTEESHFYLYVGYQLLYLLAIRGLILASSVIFDSRNKAAMLSGLFMVVIALGAGYTVHPKDISLWASPTLWWSPARWFMREMVYEEFNKTTLPFTCSRNPVDRGDIVKKVECGIETSGQAIRYFGLSEEPLTYKFYPAYNNNNNNSI